MSILLVTLPTSSEATTQRLLQALPVLEHRAVKGISEMATLYAQGHGLVGICASGILIRALAPHIADKKIDPPVVSVADDGSAVVPLLGGHHGANDLAREIAVVLSIKPAITTASDVTLKFNFEDPPAGWAMVGNHKDFVARALKGEKISVELSCPVDQGMKAFVEAMPNKAIRSDLVCEIAHVPTNYGYVPKTTMVGVGASRNCPPEELQELVLKQLIAAGRHPLSVAGISSHQLKHEEIAVLKLAEAFEVEPVFYDSETLNAHKDRLSQSSEIVYRETGCWGVAEAAALQGAGAKKLLAVKKKSETDNPMATCALAEI